jgi:hypothetical protein
MLVKAGYVAGDAVGVLTPHDSRIYFHRVVALRGRDDRDLLVCAAGDGGVGVSELRWGDATYMMRLASFDAIDVIDVCALASDAQTPAVAAVGRDGTLIFVRDAVHDPIAASIKFNVIEGTAYRLLSRKDELLLLTSRALYVLKDPTVRLDMLESTQRLTTPISVIPLEAVDVNIAGHWLLIVTPEEVLKANADAVLEAGAGSTNGPSEGVVQMATVQWERHEQRTTKRHLATAG